MLILSTDNVNDREIVQALEACGHSIICCCTNDLISRLQIFSAAAATVEDVCLLVSINNLSLLRIVTQLLKRKRLLRRPKILLLSSLLTWSGDMSAKVHQITNPTDSFAGRIPCNSAMDYYAMENSLWELSLLTQTSLVIIGFGVTYGGTGRDMEFLYKMIWNAEQEIQLPCSEIDMLPAIHFEDLIAIVSKALTNYATGGFTDQPIYVPACDCNIVPFSSLVVNLYEEINHSTCRIKHITSQAVMQFEHMLIPSTPAARSWGSCVANHRSNVCFTSVGIFDGALKHKNGLLAPDQWPVLWDNYCRAKNLLPCRVIVAGKPRCGKSEFAVGLASGIGCELVNIQSAIRYVITLPDTAAVPVQASSRPVTAASNTSAPSPLETLKADMIAAITAKLAEGVKKPPPKKGAVEQEEPLDTAAVELTAALCAALNVELVRKCLAAQVTGSHSCKRKGFVLDIWESSVVVSSPQDLAVILGPQHDADKPPCDMFVELQVPDVAVVQRLATSLGVAEGLLAKAPKDVQASVKALEAQLSAYTSKLVAVTAAAAVPASASGTNSPAAVAVVPPSHTIVVHAEGRGASAPHICRIGTVQPSPAGVLVGLAMIDLQKCHGVIGWQPAPLTVDTAAPVHHHHSSSAKAPSRIGTSTSNATTAVIGSARKQSVVVMQLAPELDQRRGRTIGQLNNELSELAAPDFKSLVSQCDELQEYLVNGVLPTVTQGLIAIARSHPQDPIQYMIDHLMTCGSEIQLHTEQAAHKNFYDILAEANAKYK